MIDWDYILQRGQVLVEEALVVWKAGGWCMPPIGITGLIMFGMGVHIYLSLRAKGFQSVSERRWRRWIDNPSERRGPIGELLDFVTGGNTIEQTATFFQEVRSTELAPFERDLRMMKICVSAAPLLGLLGTVTGMLMTFDALATGSGGEKTMGMIASGISEALITTEAGLVVALPGLFFQHQLSRKHETYKVFLAHLETVCTQNVYRMAHQQAKTTTASASTDNAISGTPSPSTEPRHDTSA